MQKKLLSIIFTVLLLTIIFSGCSEKNNNTSNSPNNNSNGETNNNTSTGEPDTQLGSLEVEVVDRNGNSVSCAEVWLWTEENFCGNPDWTESAKTTAKKSTNSTGIILFSDLEGGNYVLCLSATQYYATNKEATYHITVNIKANETTHEMLQTPTQSTTSEDNKTSNRPSLPGLYELALTALSNGTKIIDKLDDFIITGREEDNPGICPIGFADITEVDVGLDSNYLYIRYWFNGTWPDNDSNWPTINGDHIKDITCNTGIDTDNNTSTGVLSDAGAEDTVGLGYRTNTNYHFFHGFKCGPTGIENPEELRYRVNENIGTYMIAGLGYDYVIGAYPLSNLSLSAGQTITLVTWCETSSSLYHHATYDILGLDDNATYEHWSVQITLGENRTIS